MEAETQVKPDQGRGEAEDEGSTEPTKDPQDTTGPGHVQTQEPSPTGAPKSSPTDVTPLENSQPKENPKKDEGKINLKPINKHNERQKPCQKQDSEKPKINTQSRSRRLNVTHTDRQTSKAKHTQETNNKKPTIFKRKKRDTNPKLSLDKCKNKKITEYFNTNYRINKDQLQGEGGRKEGQLNGNKTNIVTLTQTNGQVKHSTL